MTVDQHLDGEPLAVLHVCYETRAQAPLPEPSFLSVRH